MPRDLLAKRPRDLLADNQIPEISQAKPTNLLSELIGIAQNSQMTIPEKIRQTESTLFPQSPEQRIASAQNVNAISQTTGISRPDLMTNNQQQFNALIRNPNLTGISPDLNREQYSTIAFAPGIAAGVLTNPIGTSAALAGYSLLNKILPTRKFIASDMNETAKAGFELADMMAKGGIVAKGMGPVTKALRYTMTNMAKPQLAQAMWFLTGGNIPKIHAERAIENPDILSPEILAKEGKEAGAEYQAVIKPLRKDRTALVDLTPVKARIDEEGLKIAPNEYSSEMHKMSPTEAKKIINWTDWVDTLVKGKVQPNYNDVEGKINEIDTALGKFYKKAEKGEITGKEPINEPFERIANIIRKELSQTLKTQFPRVAPVIERYHNYILDRQTADSFKGINASFFKALPIRMALMTVGVASKGALLPSYLATMPAFWRNLLRGANFAGKQIELFPKQLHNTFTQQEPSLIPPLIKPFVPSTETGSE